MIKDRRSFFRRGLHWIYLPLYDSLCDVLGDEWQPVDGLRTFEVQDELYKIGRSEFPGRDTVTNASAGMSYHNYGLATDWNHFKGRRYDPIPRDDPRWEEYVEACAKVGLRTLSWEKPHNEFPLPFPVRRLLDAHQKGGFLAVNHLLSNLPESS